MRRSKKKKEKELLKKVDNRLDCKTVGFFLKISKEIGKAWLKSLARAKRVSLTEAREKKTYF